MSQAHYEIVYSSLGLDNLRDQVNYLIKQGYVPVGGPIATSFNINQPVAYAQAMFKAGE